MSQRFEIDVFAYVLMSRHYHLLLRTRRANLKEAMLGLGRPTLRASIGGISEAGICFKDKRDLLLYSIWRAGHLRNEQIGNLFGISYSAVSHSVGSIQAKLKKDQNLQAKFNRFNSLFKL